MKPTITHYFAFAVFLFLASQSMGQALPPEPRDLAAMRTRYNKDLDTAIKPVHARYLVELQALLKTLTQKGDTAGATAVEKEIELLAPGVAHAPQDLIGTWNFSLGSGGSIVRTFHEDGTVTGSGLDEVPAQWKVDKDQITIASKDGGVQVLFLPLNPNGTKGLSAHGFNLTAVKAK